MFFISSDLGLDSVIINLTLFPILQKNLNFQGKIFLFPLWFCASRKNNCDFDTMGICHLEGPNITKVDSPSEWCWEKGFKWNGVLLSLSLIPTSKTDNWPRNWKLNPDNRNAPHRTQLCRKLDEVKLQS